MPNITVEETCDLFPFKNIVAILAETSNGVLHADDLLEQHLVVVSLVSRPYAMSELRGGGVPTSNSGQFSALDSGCPARIL